MCMKLWPVRDWAGRNRTRSSMCLCTGELNCESTLVSLCSSTHWNVHTSEVQVFVSDVCRTGTVTVTGQYQYPDDKPGDVDAFAREPFVVRFKAPKTGQFSDAVKDDEMVMSYKHLTLHPTSLIRSYKGVCPHTSAHHSNQHHQGTWCTVRCFATCEEDVENWGRTLFK